MNTFLDNKNILAPLTKGGNLPFRRLCVAFGADATVSEMAYARFVAKGDKRERALLKKHESEKLFGVQFAVINPEEALKAASIAIERGAQFIDINCGCPIEDTTRRGLGAAVLRKPNAIEKLVQALSGSLSVPLTVKIRLGWSERDLNYITVAQKVSDAGATALIVHGRTREQRYSRAADWDRIREIKEAIPITVVGNGDILTHYEAEQRRAQSGVSSLLIGRGALIKPWIFQELKEHRTLNPSSEEEVDVYFQLARYMKEHFGDDEIGLKRAMQFLPWHFNFFHRYQYLPKDQFEESSRNHPLIQTRIPHSEDDHPLVKALRSPDANIHQNIAVALLSAAHTPDAVEAITKIGRSISLSEPTLELTDDQLEGAAG